jgi:Immunity protein 26
MATYPPANFLPQRPYRKKLHPGDIFTMRLPDGRYLFGRVVRTDADCFGPTCILVYVFRYLSESNSPPDRLLVQDLLVPPQLVNRLGWSRGYFETIGNRPFADGELMPVHYFRRVRHRDLAEPPVITYIDEDQKAVPQPPDGVLVGGAGLGNYRTVDDAIAVALGIPVAPEE